ncbi:MAG: undecaprenyl-diphosphate phosphatase [Solirubrobacteraceae bacterium]
MAQPEGSLTLSQAMLLGIVQGPAELLPISSSGHITLLPWLLGWGYPALDPERRKSFEVALHAGTALALLVRLREEVSGAVRGLDRRRASLIAASFAPPALAGLGLKETIERRLGTPGTIAAGLLLGSAAMAFADLHGPQERAHEDARAADGLALGLAQACALMPGISRNGATLAAARLRGFRRADANVLSRHCALPVILGAVALKGRALARPDAALAVGATAALCSTLLSARAIELVESQRSLLPYAVYRAGLATLAIRRLRQTAAR